RIGPEIGAVADFAPGLTERLAGFEAFNERQVILVLQNAGGNGVEESGALGPAHAAPGAIIESHAGSADGAGGVFGGAGWPDADDLAAMAGAFAFDSLARDGVHRFSIDHHAIGAFTRKARITKIRRREIVLKAGLTEHGHGGLIFPRRLLDPFERVLYGIVWYRMAH